MIAPAGGWRPKTGRLFWKPLYPFLAILVLILLALGVLAISLLGRPDLARQLVQAQAVLAGVAVVVIVGMLLRLRYLLHEPLAYLRGWSLRMRRGELEARIPVPANGEFAELARDINQLSEELQALREDMASQVRSQTERLEQKTRSLEVLYDIAASLNKAYDLDELLTRCLQTLTHVVNARAGSLKLLTHDGRMRLVAAYGVQEKFVERERFVPVDRCLCGQALSQGKILCQTDIQECGKHSGHPLADEEPVEMLAVPLRYRDKTLGVYNLFTTARGLHQRSDIQELLMTIGRQLGTAVEKTRLDAEAQRLKIMQEREMLAYELHDSLAQSLASVRIQTQMLEESLREDHIDSARREVGQIRRTLDGCYGELRELLVHFRTKMDERGLMPAIEDMVERFRNDTGIHVFLQKECDELHLPPEHEVQVLHIVQEALTNMRKYSKAQNARVLVSCDADGNHRVLVEDDGLGIANTETGDGLPGEHIGLTVMQERAKRLGGALSIESEAGEGTRVLLVFQYPQTTSGQSVDLGHAHTAD